ncbi:MAG: NAD(P)H-hydrate epimerase [Actinomycetota bacterium]
MTKGLSVPAVTVEQMREVDRLMTEEYGILLIQMMENAGRNLAALVSTIARGGPGKSALVLAGRGNNGGGGLVAARHLSNMGNPVQVVLAARVDQLPEVQGHQASILLKMGLGLLEAEACDKERLEELLGSADVIVDALIGYSLAGAPRGLAAVLIEKANASGRPIVSLDVPSGLDAGSGRVYEPSIRASATLTLALPKTALASDEARARSGDLYLGDLSVPPGLYHRLGLEAPPLFADSRVVPLVWTGDGWVTG